MTEVTVVVIPADETLPMYVKTITNYTYKDGQEIVGGLIQPVTIESRSATCWANEEGLMLQLPINRRATRYLYAYAPEHEGYTVLVGDCYISGLPDEEDYETTSAPSDVISQLVP